MSRSEVTKPMRIGLVQLSDIHFTRNKNPVSEKVQCIAAAYNSITPVPECCLVAVTGDVAYGGATEEYEQASVFFRLLESLLRVQHAGTDVWFAFVPGNHDCDHSAQSDLREMAIRGAADTIDTLAIDGAAVKELLSVHTNFFRFRAEFASCSGNSSTQLAEWKTFLRNGKPAVDVLHLNTALMSANPEAQGKLCFPIHAIPKRDDRPVDLIVTLMHYPYTWLESENGLKLQSVIEKATDVVMTGHVHVGSAFTKTNSDGTDAQYIAGGVLQDSKNPNTSTFNIVACDTEKKTQRVHQFSWSSGLYRQQNPSISRAFIRNNAARTGFQNNDEYALYLKDLGLGLTPPGRGAQKRIDMDNLFVYPQIGKASIATPNSVEEIRSDDVLDYVSKAERVLILAPPQGGKTALARKVYSDLAARYGMVPVMLAASDLRGTTDDAFVSAVYRAFRNQYSPERLEEYRQLERSKKVLIIDEWQKAKSNTQWQSSILTLATSIFGKTLIFASDELRIEEFSGKESSTPLLGFDRCEIRQMGHYLRGKLIERWHALNADISPAEAEDRVLEDEVTISSMMRKNVLPSFPVTVLLLLQARQQMKTNNLVNGSYGYLYETLITSSLAQVAGDPTEIDTRYTFISRIAYYLFQRKQEYFTQNEVQQLRDEYLESYEISIAVERLLQDIEDARLIVKSNESFRFRYRYVFYYFVARYFQENLRSEKEHVLLTRELRGMADQAANDEYGNILMFVIYLTKDPELIEHILQNAKEAFAEVAPCDFESHVAFLNNLATAPKVELPPSSVEENRRRRRLDLDEFDQNLGSNRDEKEQRIAPPDETGMALKVAFAIRTLDLMGQVLRNFPGSLRKEIKVEIAKASYLLTLRLLHEFLGAMEQNINEVKSLTRQTIILNRPKEDPKTVDRMTNEAIFFLARIAGFGLTKRLSYSVGAKVLERTYASVHALEGAGVPVSLIDLSIRLDHLAFPENEIRGLWDRVRDNSFAATIVRDLVAEHFYLHNLENRRRQSIESLLDIRTIKKLPAPKERRRSDKKIGKDS